jgi:hypothetical protein
MTQKSFEEKDSFPSFEGKTEQERITLLVVRNALQALPMALQAEGADKISGGLVAYSIICDQLEQVLYARELLPKKDRDYEKAVESFKKSLGETKEPGFSAQLATFKLGRLLKILFKAGSKELELKLYEMYAGGSK